MHGCITGWLSYSSSQRVVHSSFGFHAIPQVSRLHYDSVPQRGDHLCGSGGKKDVPQPVRAAQKMACISRALIFSSRKIFPVQTKNLSQREIPLTEPFLF